MNVASRADRAALMRKARITGRAATVLVVIGVTLIVDASPVLASPVDESSRIESVAEVGAVVAFIVIPVVGTLVWLKGHRWASAGAWLGWLLAGLAFFFPTEDFEAEGEPGAIVEAFDTMRPFAHLAAAAALILAVAFVFRRPRPTSWWARRRREVAS